MRRIASCIAFAGCLAVAVPNVVAPAFAASDATAGFVANARLITSFLSQSAALAADRSDNAALRAFADKTLAAQAPVAMALDRRVVSQVAQAAPLAMVEGGELQSGRSVAVDMPVDAAAYAAPPGVGALLPVAATTVDHLAASRGGAFDQLYKATQRVALERLIALYDAYRHTGDDPALKQVAAQQVDVATAQLALLGASSD